MKSTQTKSSARSQSLLIDIGFVCGTRRGGEGMTIDAGNTDSTKTKYVSETISRWLTWSRKGTKWWSFANHSATIIIVAFSSIAAVIAQITGDIAIGNIATVPVKNIATTLSLIVTIVSTVQAKLGFERKWIANRMTQSALRQLEVDEKMNVPLPDLAKALKDIRAKHDRAITERPAD